MIRILAFMAVCGLTATVLCSPTPAGAGGGKKTAAQAQGAGSAALPSPRSLVAALTAPVTFEGMDDPKLELREALGFLAKRYGVAFTINDRAFQVENPDAHDIGTTPIASTSAIPPMTAPLGKVLARILARLPVPSRATFLVREDSIEITTGAFVAAEIPIERRQSGKPSESGAPARKAAGRVKQPANLPQPGVVAPPGVGGGVPPAAGPAPAIGGVLGLGVSGIVNLEDKRFNVAVVSVAIDRQSLEEALRQIRSQANISLVLDPGLDDKARPMLTVTLLNAPLDSAMQVLTEMAGLDYVWLDNIFYVTTPEKAQKLRTSWPKRRSGGGGLRHQDAAEAAAQG